MHNYMFKSEKPNKTMENVNLWTLIYATWINTASVQTGSHGNQVISSFLNPKHFWKINIFRFHQLFHTFKIIEIQTCKTGKLFNFKSDFTQGNIKNI